MSNTQAYQQLAGFTLESHMGAEAAEHLQFHGLELCTEIQQGRRCNTSRSVGVSCFQSLLIGLQNHLGGKGIHQKRFVYIPLSSSLATHTTATASARNRKQVAVLMVKILSVLSERQREREVVVFFLGLMNVGCAAWGRARKERLNLVVCRLRS